MGNVRSGVIAVAGPDPVQTRALQPRSKATFSFQFVNQQGRPIGSPTPSEVTIISVRHVSEDVFVIMYVLAHETKSMTYNARNGRGVIRPS